MAPLVSKSADVPDGVDLTGQWHLIGDARADILKPMDEDIRVDVFVRIGTSIKVTQTDYALFVSFDRAVVEEYRFGENRVVSKGAIEADRVSGWENAAYVIETRDSEGAMLVETYRLTGGGETMTRTVEITFRGDPEYQLRQVFEQT